MFILFVLFAVIAQDRASEETRNDGTVPPFVCVDGSKVSLANVCDGVPHCPDSSDERRKICHHVVCPMSMYRCAYGACIPKSARCDGLADCVDGSDEIRCEVTDTCSNRDYQCFNSLECISLGDICNGYPDCSDGSDENLTICKDYPCPTHTYRCSYGGCVHREVLCDGVKDCVDGSDEDVAICASMYCEGDECDNYQCKEHEFSCESKGQCIAKDRVCDGTHHCRDGSDEKLETCSKIQCREGFFRCAYGGCISERLRCNLEPNCHDWSDEDEEMCGISLPEGACRLPPMKPGMHYLVSDCPECRPGKVVAELIRLNFTCDVKDSLEGSSSVYCQDNRWLPALPTCPAGSGEMTCTPVVAPGAIKRCEAMWGPRQGWVSCDLPVPVGTRASLECPTFYEREFGASHSTCLHDGTWSQIPLRCVPSCGSRDSSVAPLIVKGWELSPDDPLPWHATLFSHEEGEWSFFCGGTLVAERVVLTAGHCVWKTAPETIKVVLASSSSNFTQQGEDAQILDVENIELPNSYRDHEGNYGSDLALLVLSKPATINSIIRPACVDWADSLDTSSRSGEIGLIAGMGVTENDTFSATPRVTSVQLVSDEECRNSQKKDFRKYLTYTSFCAGWRNGTGVCNGDSGGGLTLRKAGSNIWEVQGVVSISPRRLGTSFCDPQYYTVFTKVSIYSGWIKQILSTLPVIGPVDALTLPNKDVILDR